MAGLGGVLFGFPFKSTNQGYQLKKDEALFAFVRGNIFKAQLARKGSLSRMANGGSLHHMGQVHLLMC